MFEAPAMAFQCETNNPTVLQQVKLKVRLEALPIRVASAKFLKDFAKVEWPECRQNKSEFDLKAENAVAHIIA